MAAPQTHLVTSFGFRWILTGLGVIFSPIQIVVLYFWGFGMDFIDHFTSPSYTKDVFFVRIPRFLKGGAVGGPSEGVKDPICWLHLWPGIAAALVSGFVFFPAKLFWIPLLFWTQHIVVDIFQRGGGPYEDVPILYPWKKGGWKGIRWNYPIKSRNEILIASILSLVVMGVEGYLFFFK